MPAINLINEIIAAVLYQARTFFESLGSANSSLLLLLLPHTHQTDLALFALQW